MALPDDMEKLLGVLSTLEGVRTICEGWPKAEARLPAIAVERASVWPSGYCDDTRYRTRLSYYVRLFTVEAAERRRISGEIDAELEKLGYMLENAADAQHDTSRSCTMVFWKECE